MSLPPEIQQIREGALKALGDVEPAGSPVTGDEPRGLMLSSRTDGGQSLPAYYLVYFLLVDLLAFPHMGKWEKSAWTVPIRYRGRLYGIEHRKLGLGVFAPSLDPNATRSGRPTDGQEADAREITALIQKAITIAKPYFEWRAEQAASGNQINVSNKNASLFERYEFFRDRCRTLSKEAEARKDEHRFAKQVLGDGTEVTSGFYPSFSLRREAEWNAQAAIEAFFSWTEHAFIHFAILQGCLRTGDDVAQLAESDWKKKFKAALDLTDKATKAHYDTLLDIRAQLRNFLAHGSFGKRGEAFHFHSSAGAVPVLLTDDQRHRYALTGEPAFDESWALGEIEAFLEHLWSGPLEPAKHHLFSSLPSILTYVADGTYERAMESDESMREFVEYLTHEFDNAVNMDW
ncbi:hypothetical protein [Algiphilus sp.]|uniref:hypothetical protein n=1 Tax=Algiphilus sp. TaxID=1872431 RepID=UPI0025BA54D8|nr:hypothetical protein [Algiphilus sp.]MCK5772095.1 hypothetical protein [Algiphilus sp.]